METTWLLIFLALLPAEDRPRDLTGEVSVSYHQSLNECRKEAIESQQRRKERLKKQFKALGIEKEAEELVAGIVEMAICWNGKEAQLVYPKTIDSPWLAVVVRFHILSYVDKRSGRREKLGTGIARVGRFETPIECRKLLSNASAELARSLKPDEQKALICLTTGQG